MASQNIARLGVVLGLDTAEFTASIDKAISENAKLKNAIRRDTSAAAGELKSLIHATDDYGKALTKVQLIQRETTSGRFMNATDDMKKKLLEQAAAYDKIANVAKSAADAASKLAAQQNLIQRDSNTGLADISALRNATEDYGKTLTKVESIQREIAFGRYMNATKDIKDQLLQQAAAYDKVALSAKNVADVQMKLNEQQNAANRANESAEAEIKRLKNATQDYGKTLTQVEMTQREITSGKYVNATKEKKYQLLQQAAAYDKVATSTKHATSAQFKMNEQQKMQLTYQTTDLFTQIASGQSPFIAIIQQGGQLKDAMGGVGNAMKAIGSLFTVTRVLAGGFAASLGAIGLAAYQAADDLDKLRDALTLTGNYSGITEKSFIDLSKTLSGTTNASLATTKEALMAVISTGQFTGKSINAVSQAIIAYSQIAGVTATEAAEKLKGGLSGTAEGAKSLNKEMNFLTLEQYKQIEALEKAGKKQEAAQLVAIALNTKLEQQRRELGILEGAWKSVTKATSDYWEQFKELLSGPKESETLASLDKQIEFIKQKLAGTPEEEDTVFARGWRKTLATLQASKESILEVQRLQNRSTASKSVGSAKEQIDEYDKYKGMLKAKVSEVEKSKIEAAFAVAKEGAHEIELLQLESAKKLADAKLEMNQKNIQEDGRATAQNLEIYKNKAISIASETSEKIKQVHAKRMIAEYEESVRIQKEITDAELAESNRLQSIRIANQAQTREMEFQKESLDLKYKMIYATEQEQKLAQISLEYARKRKEVEEGPDKQFNLDQIDRQEQMAKMFVTMEEGAKRTQQVFDSVWGNLSSAIDNFTKTGKLNMKDFARSVIQDLIAIQMKAAALSFLRGMFSMGNPMTMTQTDFVVASGGQMFADGGNPPVGKASIVGERGPELFVPRTAGTIIPNHALGNMGSTTNVTNNYINAIDTKSFEDRLLGSSNAVWAANQYAGKSLATNRGRT